MAYYIRSLQVSNYHLRSLYDTFMVAEHAFTDPRHEDDDETNTECIKIHEQAEHEDKDMKFIGDLMPVDLDPSEAERRIKLEIVKIFAESQNQVRMEMMTSIDALNAKLSSDLAECAHSLNAKIDAVKTEQAINGDYVSRILDGNIANLSDEMATIWETLSKTTEMATIWEKLSKTTEGIEMRTSNMEELFKNLGNKHTMQVNTQMPQKMLEFTAIQNLEKYDSEGWLSKLKNALMQVDEGYEHTINATENMLQKMPSLKSWHQFGKQQLANKCMKTDCEMDKSKQELYSVLIDKCTEAQVREFENNENDGFFAYYILYNKIKTTPLGIQIQCKAIEDFREQINKETEQRKALKEFREQINQETEETGFGSGLQEYHKTEAFFKPINTDMAAVSDFDKLVADLNVMAKGRGKNYIKTDNDAKDPWATQGCDPWSKSGLTSKGSEGADSSINDGRGFPLRKEPEQVHVAHDYQQQLQSENWHSFHQHQWQSENWQASIEYETNDQIKNEKNRKMQTDTWTDVNGTKNEKLHLIIEQTEINERESEIKEKEADEQTENVIMNVKGTWEKITFTGDSGAVDHVIMPETGKAFEIKETAASKAGFGFRAANGSPIKIFGERKLNGVTESGEAFRMNCQVTDVKKNLASFVKMVNEGNDIVMSKKGSFIKNISNGKVIKLDLDKGTPQFDVWVQKTEENGVANVESEDTINESASAFQRLEMFI